MTAILAEYWPWLAAYPLIGGVITGLLMDRITVADLLFGVLCWPLLVAVAIGSFFRDLFS
jgi:hypothetical protein